MTTAEIIESELRRLCPQMSGVETVARQVAETLQNKVVQVLPAAFGDLA